MSLPPSIRRWATRRLAGLPERRGIKWLLRLQDRLFYFTLGVIKIAEGDSHPRHRVTDARTFFRDHVRAGETVLDVGSAYGHNARMVADVARHVVGLEVRPEAAARARRERPAANIDYRIGSWDALGDDERFDVVLLGNVLEHIADRPAFLAECRRHGHRLVVRVPAIDRDWMVPYRQELGLPWKLHADHQIEYTAETLTRELQDAGFTVTICYSRFGAIHAVAERVDGPETRALP